MIVFKQEIMLTRITFRVKDETNLVNIVEGEQIKLVYTPTLTSSNNGHMAYFEITIDGVKLNSAEMTLTQLAGMSERYY